MHDYLGPGGLQGLLSNKTTRIPNFAPFPNSWERGKNPLYGGWDNAVTELGNEPGFNLYSSTAVTLTEYGGNTYYNVNMSCRAFFFVKCALKTSVFTLLYSCL
jgi:hypothetical protein